MNTIKWAANQRIESVHDKEGVMFWVREAGDKATLAGEIKVANVHPDIISYAARDGLKKRVNDACASAENNVQRFETIKKLCDHFNGGAATWRVESAGAVSKRLDRAAMYQAIATVRGMDVAVVESKLREKQDDFLRSYNAIADIAAEYTRLTTKAANVDEDALFGALEE
jgi:hypothetical protein